MRIITLFLLVLNRTSQRTMTSALAFHQQPRTTMTHLRDTDNSCDIPHERRRLSGNLFCTTADPVETGAASIMEQVAIDDSLTLIPISREPVLLMSSRPLLTPEQCQMLCHYFETGAKDGPSEAVETLLNSVQTRLDQLTGCPAHSGEAPLPRYISYQPMPMIVCDHDEMQSLLLTDGLHVDTNNGKLFRHVTALLYLTTNDQGATTFPLARPLSASSISETSAQVDNYQALLLRSAQDLIDNNVHHTRFENHQPQSQILEDAAYDLFQRTTDLGIRVMPLEGRVCVFCNLDDNGMPDPFTFHGGETLFGPTSDKVALTYFKEIPMESFRNRAEFAQRASDTRRYFLERYYY